MTYPKYKVIHNSPTHFTKSVHLNGGKDFNMRPCSKRNSLYLYVSRVLSFVCNQHLAQRWIGHTTTEAQALLRWPPRSPDLTICHFCSYADILRTLPFYRLYHRICSSCEEESWLPSQKSIAKCYSGYGWQWIIVLMSAMSKGTYEVCGKNLGQLLSRL